MIQNGKQYSTLLNVIIKTLSRLFGEYNGDTWNRDRSSLYSQDINTINDRIATRLNLWLEAS